MNRFLISVYGSNFENYDHILSCMAIEDGLGVELAISPEKLGFNRRLIGQLDIFRGKLVSFHGPFEKIEASSPEGGITNQHYLESYEISFPITQAFNGQYVVMHTNQCAIVEQERKSLQTMSLTTIEKVAARAMEEEVSLLVENVGEPLLQSVLFNMNDYIKIFNKIPGVNSLIDVGHALLNNWDLEYLISSLAKKIKAYHIHSNDGIDDLHWPISRGILDVSSIARLISKYTPDALIVFEYAPYDFVGPELYKKDIKLLKKLLREN